MAKRGKIKFGSKEIQNALAEYGEDVIEEVKRIILATALRIQADARTLAPEALIDGGNLRQSIEVELLPGGLTAIVKVGAEYAVYVEFGTGIYATGPGGSKAKKIPWVYYSEKLNRWVMTSGMKAQPFWFASVDSGRRYFMSEMKKLG